MSTIQYFEIFYIAWQTRRILHQTMSDCESESLVSFDSAPRIRKKGIVYLSSIPKYMNVTKLRELLGHYGEIGRVFLQPASNRNTWSLFIKH